MKGIQRFLALALLLGLAPSGSAWAQAPALDFSGRVYLDANRNGTRDPGEAGVADVLVTNGSEVAKTDAQGRYRLPAQAGFVSLSRPAGYEAARWYARGASDFGLVPAPDPEAFFFVQVSDSHVYDRVEDFEEFSSPGAPWFLPQLAVDWITLKLLDRVYAATSPDGVAAGLRSALVELAAEIEDANVRAARVREIEALGDIASLRAYTEEFRREGSPLADVGGAARRAFEEVAALAPDFIVNTGDLVLEGNTASAEAIDRWLHFYQSITAALPMTVYDTIGNNEIAGTQNPAFAPTDPGYGKQSFERALGPTHYSFDRGPFHFVALDTHRPDPSDEKPKWWSFQNMDEDVSRWVQADLSASRARVPIVLNHEPFHIDPAWPLDNLEPADDEGLLARFQVPYALTGHAHFNSFVRTDATTHITTGALSGMRWVLPVAVHPRGYRLFWARAAELHSAWKQLGEPLVALAEGGRNPDEVVVVAADRRAPFSRLTITRAGELLVPEPWGDYFFRIPDAAGGGPLEIVATSASGEQMRATLTPPAPPPTD